MRITCQRSSSTGRIVANTEPKVVPPISPAGTNGPRQPREIIHRKGREIRLPQASPNGVTRRNILKSLPFGAAALLPCGCPRTALAAPEPWSYGNLEGPAKWTGLCNFGERQSPINFPLPEEKIYARKGLNIRLEYSPATNLDFINTGHGNIQVNVPDGSHCLIKGKKMRLLQWHFHTPSEHAFGGARMAMEAHFVHKNVSTGELAVIGIMLRRGGTHELKALQIALDNSPCTPDLPPKTLGPINLDDLLSGVLSNDISGGHYEHYVGSLTTPPCSEGVQWYVATQPGFVTDSQILDFEAAVTALQSLSTNARPLQPVRPGCIDIQTI